MLIQDMEECWRPRVGCAVTVQCIVASSIIFRSYSDWARPPWRSTPPAAAWAAQATSGSLQQWIRHVSNVSMEEGEHWCEISYHLVNPLLNFLAVIKGNYLRTHFPQLSYFPSGFGVPPFPWMFDNGWND